MAAQDKTVKTMRPEKLQFMGMRNAYKVTSELVDPLLGWKDQMHEIAFESGLNANYLIKEMLTQLGLVDAVLESCCDDDDDDDAEDDDDDTEDGEEELEGPANG